MRFEREGGRGKGKDRKKEVRGMDGGWMKGRGILGFFFFIAEVVRQCLCPFPPFTVQKRDVEWFPHMQAMLLLTEEMEGEQNEIALLRSQMTETNNLVKVLSAQLGDLQQRVGICVMSLLVTAFISLCMLCVYMLFYICSSVVFLVWLYYHLIPLLVISSDERTQQEDAKESTSDKSEWQSVTRFHPLLKSM